MYQDYSGVLVNKVTLNKYKELKNNNQLEATQSYVITDIDDYLEAILPILNLDSYTRNNLPTTNMNYNIEYVNGYYFITGSNGNLLTSTDGVNWTQHNVGTNQTNNAIYFNNKYIVLQGRYVKYSEDLINWNQASTTNTCYGIATDGINLIAGGSSIMKSTDGTNWSQKVGSITGNKSVNNICYGNGLFVAVGTNGLIMISSDGEVWNYISTTNTNDLEDVAFGNGLFVAIGNYTIMYSTDGVTWNYGIQNSNRFYERLTYLNNVFYIESGATLLTTSNGYDYETIATGITGDFYINGITNNGSVLALVSRNYIYISNLGKSCNLQEIVDYFISKTS